MQFRALGTLEIEIESSYVSSLYTCVLFPFSLYEMFEESCSRCSQHLREKTSASRLVCNATEIH